MAKNELQMHQRIIATTGSNSLSERAPVNRYVIPARITGKTEVDLVDDQKPNYTYSFVEIEYNPARASNGAVAGLWTDAQIGRLVGAGVTAAVSIDDSVEYEVDDRVSVLIDNDRKGNPRYYILSAIPTVDISFQAGICGGTWVEELDGFDTLRVTEPLNGTVEDKTLTLTFDYNPTGDAWITLSESGSCELEVKHNNAQAFTTSISTITSGSGDENAVNVSANILRFDAKGHFTGTTTEDININLNLDIPEELDDLDDVTIAGNPNQPVEGSILYHDGGGWVNFNPPNDETNSFVLVYDGSKAVGEKLNWLQLIDFACPSS